MDYLIIKCICAFLRSLVVETGFISIVDVIKLIFFKEWLQDKVFLLSKVRECQGIHQSVLWIEGYVICKILVRNPSTA